MTAEITDWDDAYANGAYIEGAAEYPPRWAAAAAAYRARVRADLDVAYEEHPRQVMDVFWPDETPKGVAVFVHGGYWLKFDKSYWSHLAEGARAAGWLTALPSYVLSPEARISEITAMIGQAIEALAARQPGPIRLSGHSAGGHLVSRMACADGPLSADTAGRLAGVLSISGLHDLRPLRNTAMNNDWRMDEAEAEAESAALTAPLKAPNVTAWVGAEERPEFIRQTELLADAWRGACTIETVIEPGRHHFDVIDGLASPDAPITRAFISG